MTTETDPFEAVLEAVADGATLVEACRKPGMPNRKTFQRRCRADAEFLRLYEQALQDRAEVRATRYNDILNKVEDGILDAPSARVLLEGIRFQMGNDDRRYVERTRIEATGRDGKDLIPATTKPDELETARWIAHLLYRGGVRRYDEDSITAFLSGPADNEQP